MIAYHGWWDMGKASGNTHGEPKSSDAESGLCACGAKSWLPHAWRLLGWPWLDACVVFLP